MPQNIIDWLRVRFALFVWLGGIYLNIFIVTACIIFYSLRIYETYSIAFLVVWISLGLLPAKFDSPTSRRVSNFICRNVMNYFPLKVYFDVPNSLNPNQAYVIGLEPHSVLPISLIALSSSAGLTPLKNPRTLATSAIFYVPFLKHIWTFLGLAPASKSVFLRFLREGTSVALVPGGVQECLYMHPSKEVAFLRRRTGFVKLAIKTGTPIVPAFSFGQSRVYSWWMPRGAWYTALSRKLGFAPLIFWGVYGTPIPFPSPITVVVGEPILVEQSDDPSDEKVRETLEKFILSMEDIFHRYKDSLNYGNIKLEIL